MSGTLKVAKENMDLEMGDDRQSTTESTVGLVQHTIRMPICDRGRYGLGH